MALWNELSTTPAPGGALSDESQGKTFGEIIRTYQPKPGVNWRFGKPNYARVNKFYFENRDKKHPEGSLESVVSQVVKNWEVDTHHVADPAQWSTVDINGYKFSINDDKSTVYDAKGMAEVGPYVALLQNVPGKYDGAKHTFESTNKLFSETFPLGFAWECLEVYSGPPSVTFKWRHFGKFTGKYVDVNGKEYAGTGMMVNLYGVTVATVDDNLLVKELKTYYNPDDMISPLMKSPMPQPPAPSGGCAVQ
jgi:hypothetical protein